MTRIGNFITTELLFILTTVPCLLFTCFFYVGIGDELITRFEANPISIIEGRILFSLLFLIPIVLIFTLLEYAFLWFQKKEIIRKTMLRKVLLKISFGFVCILSILLLEYLTYGYIV